jgi:hypothetical protein
MPTVASQSRSYFVRHASDRRWRSCLVHPGGDLVGLVTSLALVAQTVGAAELLGVRRDVAFRHCSGEGRSMDGAGTGVALDAVSLSPHTPLIPINLLDPEHSLGRDYTGHRVVAPTSRAQRPVATSRSVNA